VSTRKVAANAPTAGEFTAPRIPVLLNATRVTVNGTPMGHGDCKFHSPIVSLAPNERTKEADEVWVNTITCTSVWQIGTPTSLTAPSGPNYSGASQEAGVASVKSTVGMASPGAAASLTSSSGYGKAWFEDGLGFTTTSDQSNIAWQWNGSCVTSANGSATWNWYFDWQPPTNRGAWINTYCVWSKVWSQADFRNTNFCAPITVDTHYRGVSIRGWGNGQMDGWVDSYWTDHACLPLFAHFQPVRTA
jgi:hypothetical protein